MDGRILFAINKKKDKHRRRKAETKHKSCVTFLLLCCDPGWGVHISYFSIYTRHVLGFIRTKGTHCVRCHRIWAQDGLETPAGVTGRRPRSSIEIFCMCQPSPAAVLSLLSIAKRIRPPLPLATARTTVKRFFTHGFVRFPLACWA